MDSRLVWYQLVDSQGEPFQDMDASAVSLAANAVVGQLQEAIKGKDGGAFPTLACSSQLDVFASEQDACANTLALSPNDTVPSNDFASRLYVVVPHEAVPAPQRRVWYQLVDVRGVPLEDTMPSSVEVSANTLIDRLQELVEGKDGHAFPTAMTAQVRVFLQAHDVLANTNALAHDAAVPTTTYASPLLVVVPEEREPGTQSSKYKLSELNEEHADRILKKLQLRTRHFDIREPVDTSVPGYEWLDVEEDDPTQREGYVTYLRTVLKPLMDSGRFQLIDVADDESLLSIKDPRLPFQMSGTTDVILTEQYKVDAFDVLAGVRLVIEVKKAVETSDLPEALGQLVSCSLKADYGDYPMSLLTDLNKYWHFSWFNDKHELAILTLEYPKNAVDFILASVKPDDADTFHVPFVEQPLKKRKIEDFVPMPSDGADEMMERWELMADVLDPEFLNARRTEYAQHLVRSMPAFAHMFE